MLLVGSCAQAQGQGLTPAIRAGKGGGDAGSLSPRRSATRIRCTRVMVHRQRIFHLHTVHHPSTTSSPSPPLPGTSKETWVLGPWVPPCRGARPPVRARDSTKVFLFWAPPQTPNPKPQTLNPQPLEPLNPYLTYTLYGLGGGEGVKL